MSNVVGKAFVAVLFAAALTACGDSSQIMGGKFGSLQQCLSSIRSKTGLSLDPVIDKPDEVTGYLSGTKRDFACTRKSTGTQGVYWEGWYEVKR